MYRICMSMKVIKLRARLLKFSMGWLIFFTSQCMVAQAQVTFKPHELVDVRDGYNIEILQCSGTSENDVCEVIFYKDKRQSGQRLKMKSDLVNRLRNAASGDVSADMTSALQSQRWIDSLKAIFITSRQINLKVHATSRRTDTTISMPVSNVVQDRKADTLNKAKPPVVSTAVLTRTKEKTSPYTSSFQTIIYTLKDCFAIALQKNTDLRKTRNLVASATIDNKTARYALLPSLSYDLGHNFSFGKNIDPVTNAFSYKTFSGGYTSLNLQLQIFGGFKKLYAIKQSAFMLSATKYNEQKIELELLSNVTFAFARIILNNEELEIKRKGIANTQKETEAVSEKIKVGRLSKYEYYTFDGMLNTQLAELADLQNDSSNFQQALKQLLNFPFDQNLPTSSVDTGDIKAILATNINVEETGEKIIKNHPAIRLAEMNEQTARVNAKIAKAALLPSLSVGGNVVSNYNIDQEDNNGKIALTNQLNNNLGQNVNISLRIPVFSQLQNINRIKKEKLNIANAQLGVEAERDVTTTNTLQLINDFNTSRQKYLFTQKALHQNALSYDLSRERYRLGQISSIDLFAAQNIFDTASSKFLQSKLQLYFQYEVLKLLLRN